MNDDTWALVTDVVGRVQHAINLKQAPAIVILDGDRRQILSDYDYQHDQDTAHAFEHTAADRARALNLRRFAFAVPRVILETAPGSYDGRAVSNHPLRAGEQETIVWTAYDTAGGADFGLAGYTRRPNGRPVFDEPEIFDVPIRADDRMPGVRLLRQLTDT